MLTRIVARPWPAALLLTLLVGPLFALTAVYEQAEVNVDAEAAAIAAWSFATRGTSDLADLDPVDRPRAAEVLDRNPWVSAGPEGTFSDRPPGLWLAAVPLYWLLGDQDYSPVPATITAVLATTAAVVVAHLVLRRVTPPEVAWLGALGLALLTSTWPISSAQLWPHGLGQLLMAVTLLALAHQRLATASAALALAVTVRPVLLAVPLVLALLDLRRRRWGAGLVLGAGASIGAMLVVAYNVITFGALNLSGGYAGHFQDRLVGQAPLDYVGNLVLFLVSPNNGLLVWTPILIPAAIGARRVWSQQPSWIRHGAVAAAAYLLLHARMNRVSGGLPFDYRYPLEPIVLLLPLAVAGIRWCVATTRTLRFAVMVTGGISLVLQALMAVTADCAATSGSSLSSCSLL